MSIIVSMFNFLDRPFKRQVILGRENRHKLNLHNHELNFLLFHLVALFNQLALCGEGGPLRL